MTQHGKINRDSAVVACVRISARLNRVTAAVLELYPSRVSLKNGAARSGARCSGWTPCRRRGLNCASLGKQPTEEFQKLWTFGLRDVLIKSRSLPVEEMMNWPPPQL